MNLKSTCCKSSFALLALASTMLLGNAMQAQSTMSSGSMSSSTSSKPAQSSMSSMSSSKSMPTEAQIADAKSKGMVWVNTSSKVYHKDDQYYGKTKNGKFMTEADAQKMGAHLAKPSPMGKKSATAPASGTMAH